jgi:site-specific DNA recombinase
MKAALSIRVSDDEQVREGFSIDAQRSLLIRKCAEWGYDIVGEYVDDGYSAKNMKRPYLQKLLADVPIKGIDVVVFWRLDRWTRSSKDFHKLDELLSRHNCGIRSATEPIDTTTALGRFQLQLSVLLGQLERETTAERVHFVMEDRHRKGFRQGAVAPYGYDLVEGKLLVNEGQAEVIKRIFSLYQKNKSTRHISKLLNGEGVPKGEESLWADHSVYYILTNPVYCGKLRWNYRKVAGARTGREIIIEGQHEAIINEEEFERVQQMRVYRKRVGKKATSDFPFTGVLRCGRCGYGMIGSSRMNKNGRKRYYKCVGRFNYGVCDLPIIAEETVTVKFLALFDLPVKELEKKLIVRENRESEVNTKQLQNELEAINRRKKKWQLAYANDVISLDDLRSHTEEDKAREELIKSQLEASPALEKMRWTQEEIIQQLKQISGTWNTVEDETAKKNFINAAFEHITINTTVTDAKGGPGRKIPITLEASLRS